jgi:hypothetical protein
LLVLKGVVGAKIARGCLILLGALFHLASRQNDRKS